MEDKQIQVFGLQHLSERSSEHVLSTSSRVSLIVPTNYPEGHFLLNVLARHSFMTCTLRIYECVYLGTMHSVSGVVHLIT